MATGYSILLFLSTLSVDAFRLLRSGVKNIDELLRYVHLDGVLQNQFVDDVVKLWNSIPSYLIRIGNNVEILLAYAEQNLTAVLISACSLLITLFTAYRKIKARRQRQNEK